MVVPLGQRLPGPLCPLKSAILISERGLSRLLNNVYTYMSRYSAGPLGWCNGPGGQHLLHPLGSSWLSHSQGFTTDNLVSGFKRIEIVVPELSG